MPGDFYTPADFPDEHADWLDDLPGSLRGEPLEALVEWSEQGLEGPETWTNYDVFMDDRADSVHVAITDEFGEEYSFDISVDLEDIDFYDWSWDLWDYIDEYFDWVEEESKYSEA